MRHTWLHASVLAALLFAAGGCGGGGSEKISATTAGGGATTSAASTAATTGGSATTAGSTTTAASGLSSLTSAKNCRQLATLGNQFSQAISGAGYQGDVKKAARLLHEFAARTPADVRDDFQVVADAYSKVADAVGNLKIGAVPDPATIAKLQKLAGQLDEQKLTQAWTHIGTWVADNCQP